MADGQPELPNDGAPPVAPVEPAAAAIRHGVIVAGMHRSGTSALTRILAARGFGLPHTLVPANAGNELGHWESAPICVFNDRLLARAGQNWIGWGAIEIDWPAQSDYADLVAEASALFLAEFGDAGDLVFKDPRVCRLLPFWIDVLTRLGIAILVVLAYRHPLEVGQSLERRNLIQPAYGMLAWLRFMLDAERASRGVERRLVGFDDLLSDWRAATQAVADWAGKPPVASADGEDIAAFLGAGLRHFAEGRSQAALPPWVDAADRVFRDWREAEEDPEVLSKLDAVAGSLDQAFPLFSSLVTPNDHVRRIEADLDAAWHLLRARDAELAAITSMRAAAAADVLAIATDMERGATRLRELAVPAGPGEAPGV